MCGTVDRVTTLRCERLLLRPWTDADTDPFVAMGRDPEVMRHFPDRLTEEQSRAMIGRIRGHLAEHGWGLWAVEARTGPYAGRFLGYTGLAAPRFAAHFTPAVEVGWRFARFAWGHGYATEAGRLALEHGFTAVGLDEIVSFTTAGNTRSRAVMERLGLTRDPADDFDHPGLATDHPLRHHVLYRIRRPAR